MATINVTGVDGDTRSIEIESGLSLMEVLKEEDYEEITAICGGGCSCATCHVLIDASACDNNETSLPPIEEDELMLLEMADHYQEGASRLSCQIELGDEYDGLHVTIIESDF